MRNRNLMLTAVALPALALWAAKGLVPAVESSEQIKLPGARPVIDAARFPGLQAALDALPPDGGIVHLPPGTFSISQPLRITQQDVLLQGSGTATHIQNTNSAGEPALIIEPKQYPDNPRARIWRIHLSDFRITGNQKSGHGIVANGVNELFVHGVTVSYHGGDGIHMVGCYEDPRIIGCLITYNKGTGLSLRACHDIVVSANQFEENQDALQCLDSFNLCMTGNNLDDHLGDGVVIENTYGSVLAGNMIEECKGTAIVLDRDCYGISLCANVIAHNFGGGIDLHDAHGCAVSANTFTIVKQNALVVRSDSGRITVVGNNFSDSFIGRQQIKRRQPDRAAAGIILAACRDLAISANLFSGLSTKAVTLQDGQPARVLFSNNVLTEVTSDHARLPDSLTVDNLASEP